MQSSNVVAGDQATAAQYNNLRTDLLAMYSLPAAIGRLSASSTIFCPSTDITAATSIYYNPPPTSASHWPTLMAQNQSTWRLDFANDTGQKSFALSFSASMTIASGSPTITTTRANILKVAKGMTVSGTGISGGTTVSAVAYDGNQITLSANATSSGAYVLTFTCPANTNYDVGSLYDTVNSNWVLVATPWASDTSIPTLRYTNYQYFRLEFALTDYAALYLGSFRTTSVAGQTEDSLTNRLVWNYFNRRARPMTAREATSHTYNGAVRKWNNSDTNNLLTFIVGAVEDSIQASIQSEIKAGADGSYAVTRLYLNGSHPSPSPEIGNYNIQLIGAAAWVNPFPQLGLNTIQGYELGNHASSTFNVNAIQAVVWG